MAATVEAVCRRPALRQRFVPDAKRAEGPLASRHARFRQLYAVLRPHFKA